MIVACVESLAVGIDWGVRLMDFFLLGMPMCDNLILIKRVTSVGCTVRKSPSLRQTRS